MDKYKLKWSNWHITININRERVDDLFWTNALVDFCQDMCSDELVWRWLRHVVDGHQETFSSDTKSLVDTIRARVSIERQGKRNKSLHAHVLLEVGHSTMVQIDYQALTQLARAVFGNGVNVQGRFVRGEGDEKAFILQYIDKERAQPRTMAQRKLQESELLDTAENLLPL